MYCWWTCRTLVPVALCGTFGAHDVIAVFPLHKIFVCLFFQWLLHIGFCVTCKLGSQYWSCFVQSKIQLTSCRWWIGYVLAGHREFCCMDETMLQAIIVEQAFIHGSGNLIKLLISCMTNIQLNCTVDDKNLAKVGPALELEDFC
jgi:hypothetical protein